MANEEVPPIDFEKYTPYHFIKYLLSLKSEKNTRLSIVSYAMKCSSLFHLFQLYGFKMSRDYDADMNTLYKGFKQTFLTLTWNLMCRTTNTCTVYLHHLEWVNDSLGVYFAHTKTDQCGGKKKRPAAHLCKQHRSCCLSHCCFGCLFVHPQHYWSQRYQTIPWNQSILPIQ